MTSPASPMARWADVMEAFAERDVWGVRELAAHTGLPRSAVASDAPRDDPPGAARGGGCAGPVPCRPVAGSPVGAAGGAARRPDRRPTVHGGRRRGARRDPRARALLPGPSPVLGRRRGRVDPSHPLHLGSAAAVERPAPGVERQGHPGLPARVGARRRSSATLPDPLPGPRSVPIATCASELGRAPVPAVTSSATASGSLVPSGSRRPSGTRRVGSSATWCSAGPTTARAPRRRRARRTREARRGPGVDVDGLPRLTVARPAGWLVRGGMPVAPVRGAGA